MLEWATGFFRSRQVPSPRLSIEWLLAHVLNVKRLDLYLQFDRPLTSQELDELRPLVRRRATHEPLQYITGSTDFYNITVRVTPDVLIPRPETEQMVERILQEHPADKEDGPVCFLDIGTGSGCIALAVKKARPHWQVTGIDISSSALQVAERNAHELALDVNFEEASLEQYQPSRKLDIIASNPPYIEADEAEGLPREVIGFEPSTALTVPDVTEVYLDLFRFCLKHLVPQGSFYFEINESSGGKLLNLCNKYALHCRLEKDYSDKDRFLLGKLEK